MTLALQTPSNNIVAVANQTVFPFTFRLDDSTLIGVFTNDAPNAPGDYAVARNADQIATPGGTVTFVVGRNTGDVVSIERASPAQQSLALTTYSPFPSPSIMGALDKIVMLLQEFLLAVSRSLKVSRSGASKVASFDAPAPAVGQLIGWVDAGNGLAKLGNVAVSIVSPQAARVRGELLTDSGDHSSFLSANIPLAGTAALYRNGQRVFAPDDFALVGRIWTLTTPINPALGEKINADYDHA